MNRFIENYHKEEFDIIIIGGGITGAAVAYDASLRGLKVALLEKDDFGGATSAATSKLIHGGLRYLNNFEFSLVRESLRERRYLENIAPNFVYPLPFMIPHYNGFNSNKWLIKTGLNIYDLLSYDRKWTWDKTKRLPKHQSMSREEALEAEPNVIAKGLTGASIYYDCQSISPERLTLSFIKSALRHGAKVSNHAKVHSFIYSDEKKIEGVKVIDQLNNKEIEMKGRLTINCGGPWADIILNIAEHGESQHHIKRSEGIHLITNKLVNQHAVVLMPKDGRHFFLIPWKGHSLIGTTDKEYIGNPDNYRVTQHGIEDFIGEINKSFGNVKLAYNDIKFAYGGLRPIIDDQTEGTYDSSRKYEIYDNAVDGFEGIITVEGGKYTTSRNLAANTMKIVEKKINRSIGKSQTEKRYLYGCEIRDISSFLKTIKTENNDYNEKTMEYLGKDFGTESKEVLKIARSNREYAEVINEDREILAEVVYSVRNEMARTLKDILFRRTSIGQLGHPGHSVLQRIAKIAAEELNWDDSKLQKEISDADKALSLP